MNALHILSSSATLSPLSPTIYFPSPSSPALLCLHVPSACSTPILCRLKADGEFARVDIASWDGLPSSLPRNNSLVQPLEVVEVPSLSVSVVLYAPAPLSPSCLPLERLLEAKVSSLQLILCSLCEFRLTLDSIRSSLQLKDTYLSTSALWSGLFLGHLCTVKVTSLSSKSPPGNPFAYISHSVKISLENTVVLHPKPMRPTIFPCYENLRKTLTLPPNLMPKVVNLIGLPTSGRTNLLKNLECEGLGRYTSLSPFLESNALESGVVLLDVEDGFYAYEEMGFVASDKEVRRSESRRTNQ